MQNKFSQPRRIDFSRQPYRGIFGEIARNQGITRQAVRQAYWIHKSPKVVELVNRKIRHINKIMAEHREIIGESNG